MIISRRQLMSNAATIAAAGFTAGMTVSQKANAIEDEMAKQLAKTRTLPWVCSIGDPARSSNEGLGFDGSPVAHQWRTMIWPNNFL